MTDRYLLEAMREVDELTPACPPIAPNMSPYGDAEPVGFPHEFAEFNARMERIRRGVSENSGMALKLEAIQAANRRQIEYVQLMQNAVKTSDEELDAVMAVTRTEDVFLWDAGTHLLANLERERVPGRRRYRVAKWYEGGGDE